MPARTIKEYRLRPAARRDLERIWIDTAATWGEPQAERYIRDMTKAFALLVKHPEMARERDELTPPMRVKRSGSHLVLYQIAEDHIDIIRIRHAREDWMSDPVGEHSGSEE